MIKISTELKNIHFPSLLWVDVRNSIIPLSEMLGEVGMDSESVEELCKIFL